MTFYKYLIRIVFLTGCFLSGRLTLDAHTQSGKIVYLVSMPRSCSTAFMRMMEASEEFYILHEPAIYAFVQSSLSDQELTAGWFTDNALKTHEEVKRHILEKAADSPVFVKEICFFVQDFLLQDDEFVSNPSIHFVFLIRDPHNSIISYYKKFMKIPADFSKFIGCRSVYEIYNGIKEKAKNPVHIILAEDLGNHPKETVERLFSSLSIPFDEKCLHWEDLGDNFTGAREWNEVKVHEMLYHWHDHAIRSTGFHSVTQNAVDQGGKPTFEEVVDEAHRQDCFEIYKENVLYYQKLREEKSVE